MKKASLFLLLFVLAIMVSSSTIVNAQVLSVRTSSDGMARLWVTGSWCPATVQPGVRIDTWHDGVMTPGENFVFQPVHTDRYEAVEVGKLQLVGDSASHIVVTNMEVSTDDKNCLEPVNVLKSTEVWYTQGDVTFSAALSAVYPKTLAVNAGDLLQGKSAVSLGAEFLDGSRVVYYLRQGTKTAIVYPYRSSVCGSVVVSLQGFSLNKTVYADTVSQSGLSVSSRVIFDPSAANTPVALCSPR